MKKTFEQILDEIESADEAGDHLRSLKATKASMLYLARDEEDSRARRELLLSMRAVGNDIIKLEGLVREFSPEEESELDKLAMVQQLFGKEGVGLD